MFWGDVTLIFGGKKRNKKTLELLAVWHAQGRSGQEIMADLGLDRTGLLFLNTLAMLPGGWHSLQAAPPLARAEFFSLAGLGLIIIKGFWRRRLYLSDAARFLLVLCAGQTTADSDRAD